MPPSPDEDLSAALTGLVAVGVDVVLGLDEPELRLGRTVVVTGALEVASAFVDDLRLAVGDDHAVEVRVFERKELPVERASVQSCDGHTVSVDPVPGADRLPCDLPFDVSRAQA